MAHSQFKIQDAADMFMPRARAGSASSDGSIKKSNTRSSNPNGPQILTFALQKRPRATRASVPKVRTGCITCKRRHVKCDEAKPFCQRCIKWQGYCDGYDAAATTSASSSTSTTSSAGTPKSSRRSSTPGSSTSPPPSTSAEQAAQKPHQARRKTSSPSRDAHFHQFQAQIEPSSKRRNDDTLPDAPPLPVSFDGGYLPPSSDLDPLFFANDVEKSYFQGWHVLTGVLGGAFFSQTDESFWRRTIPKLSRQHASIRYAAMAIGAVGTALQAGSGSGGEDLQAVPMPFTPAELRARGPHYDQALMYYNKAMQEVRSAAISESSLRAAIVCCILFICFEALHGDGSAALAHIAYGQKMMDELVRSYPTQERKRKRAMSASGSSRAMSALEDEMLERETLHVFQRLVFQSWSSGITRGSQSASLSGRKALWGSRHGSPSRSPSPCVMEAMPDCFETLEQAKRWWDAVQHYVAHQSTSSSFKRDREDSADDIAIDPALLTVSDHHSGRGSNSSSRRSSNTSLYATSVDGSLVTEPLDLAFTPWNLENPVQCEHFLQLLHRWHSGFKPLHDLARQHRHVDVASYLTATTLQIHYLTVWTCMRAPIRCPSIEEMTPHYREVLRLSRILLEHQHQHQPEADAATGLDGGPTWPLFITAHRCRDAEVREEALSLLQQFPRRHESSPLWGATLPNTTAAQTFALPAGIATVGLERHQSIGGQSASSHCTSAMSSPGRLDLGEEEDDSVTPCALAPAERTTVWDSTQMTIQGWS